MHSVEPENSLSSQMFHWRAFSDKIRITGILKDSHYLQQADREKEATSKEDCLGIALDDEGLRGFLQLYPSRVTSEKTDMSWYFNLQC